MSARLKFRGWKLYATAVASFACGSVITALLTHVQEVKADSNRAFKLMGYHAQPGKVPPLESIFKDVSKLQAKHGLNIIGYWVPDDDSAAWKGTFVTLSLIPVKMMPKRTGMHCTPTRHFSLTEMRLCL
jgi:hypothetical protein